MQSVSPTLEEAHSTYIPTHKWPPKSVRPELSRTLTSLWQSLASHPEDENLWIMASIFFRCILPAGQDLNLDDNFSKMQQIKERLRRWQTSECGALWEEAKATQVVKARRGRRRKGAVGQDQLSLEERNAMRCKTKAQEGQYTRAVQALVSCGLAEFTPASLAEMQQKHPPPARPQPPPPVTNIPSKSFTSSEVAEAALSFQKGSAAGPSGMRPEHLKSILKNTSSALANKALAALTRAVNVMAAGKVPQQVRPFLCGARLVAGAKKDNSLRPIAVGNLLRRVVAKCFSRALAQPAAAVLAPNQLGVGVRGGAEAIAHAVSEAVKEDPGRWVLQADLVNAFNVVDRGVVLEQVANLFPECLAWAETCYGTTSWLKFGEAIIASATGLHQGDPLAGFLFCLVLKLVVDAIEEEVSSLILNAWYLDDGHIIGSKEELAQVVDIIVREGKSRGLTLSMAATVRPPSQPKSLVWSSMGGIGDDDQDPLQRGTKACLRKKRETEDACRQEGLVFVPFALETLGGFHSGALAQVKLLGSALARSKGLDENEVTSQFFGRISLCLMRGNAVILSSRSPDQDIPVPEIDGLL